MITKIKPDIANVELDVYNILIDIGTEEELEDAIGLIRKEFNKGLGNVHLCIQVKNLICIRRHTTRFIGR